MVTVLAFVFAIAILVAVHEFGHYGAALLCGVKVLRFSIGFGPRLFGWTSAKSGTEFVVCLLPLGGYVKMVDGREGLVAEEDQAKAFNVQPLRSRVAIVSAGPLANLLFAVLLYAGVNWAGVEQAQPILSKPPASSVAAAAGIVGGERVQRAGFEGEALQDIASFEDFRWWITRGALAHRNIQMEFGRSDPSTDGVKTQRTVLELDGVDASNADAKMFQSIGVVGPYSKAVLGDLVPDGAATQAGLAPGDEVLQVDQTVIVDAGQLRALIRDSGQTGTVVAQQWTVNRGGILRTFTVVPKVETVGDLAVGRVGAFIGVQPAMVTVRFGFVDGLDRALTRTWEVSVLTLKMMGKILTGDASLQNLSGPLTIADYAGKTATMGLTPFLIFLALISISLGVLNLLPLPVLDGGHLMYYLWESLTGKPVSEAWLERLQRVGLVVLMMMMSVAVFNDFARLLG
jgi:regulator of sigma E protease